MRNTTIALPFVLILLLASGDLLAFDPANGRQLLQQNCFECHGTELYTRAERRVTSRPGLTRQVQRCELALGLKWFDDEVEDVAGYLNQEYYKFGN